MGVDDDKEALRRGWLKRLPPDLQAVLKRGYYQNTRLRHIIENFEDVPLTPEPEFLWWQICELTELLEKTEPLRTMYDRRAEPAWALPNGDYMREVAAAIQRKFVDEAHRYEEYRRYRGAEVEMARHIYVDPAGFGLDKPTPTDDDVENIPNKPD